MLKAIERHEAVTLSKRGREIALIPPKKPAGKRSRIEDSAAFGMWKDRAEMRDPVEYVQRVRKGRLE